jgi:glycosyltransferase involved in cell wall biosynthesis
MHFHLIVSTIYRTDELGRLFESLAHQTHRDFSVILVDQNPDDRLVEIVAAHQSDFPIRHMHSPKGLSRGRNAGLACLPESRPGEIVAFPDDDCWYAPDVFARVSALFESHPEWGGLTGRSITPTGTDSNGRWHHVSGKVTSGNVWNRSTSFSIFLRRDALDGLAFDESLGVGANTLWGGAEDFDIVLQVIGRQRLIHFDPTITIYHPEWSKSGYSPAVYQKAASYARGMGRVLRKHRCSPTLVAWHLIRPFGGMLLSVLAGKRAKAHYHWSVFTGRLYGWMAAQERPSA